MQSIADNIDSCDVTTDSKSPLRFNIGHVTDTDSTTYTGRWRRSQQRLLTACDRAVIKTLIRSLSSVGTGWMIQVVVFDSRRGLGIFLFTTASRTALESAHPPKQWVPGALSLGVKRLDREADHSPPFGSEVKE
jgi:hypothetical protein